MPIQRYKPEQIVTMLRQIEVGIANGKTTPQACKEATITVQTFYRWRKEYGGLKMDQAERLKELEKENGKLKRLLMSVNTLLGNQCCTPSAVWMNHYDGFA
jgi:putative transposase